MITTLASGGGKCTIIVGNSGGLGRAVDAYLPGKTAHDAEYHGVLQSREIDHRPGRGQETRLRQHLVEHLLARQITAEAAFSAPGVLAVGEGLLAASVGAQQELDVGAITWREYRRIHRQRRAADARRFDLGLGGGSDRRRGRHRRDDVGQGDGWRHDNERSGKSRCGSVNRCDSDHSRQIDG
jgi:hypothetical protein